MSALTTVRKFFPNVEEVVDAKESIVINVKELDSRRSSKKDPANCALVHACKRMKIADAAIIGISFSYLIKGTKATRYKTSQSVGREITTFDRHGEFAAGENYRLSRIAPRERLGAGRGGWGGKGGGKPPRKVHRTAFIRKLRD